MGTVSLGPVPNPLQGTDNASQLRMRLVMTVVLTDSAASQPRSVGTDSSTSRSLHTTDITKSQSMFCIIITFTYTLPLLVAGNLYC